MIDPVALARFNRRASSYRRRMGQGPVAELRARERAVVRALLDVQAGEAVLDAGCGAGFDAAWLQAAGAVVVGVDASEEMSAQARQVGVDARVADLSAFSLGRVFDKAICLGALEFCTDPRAALAGILEHLRPGGQLVLLYPCMGVWSRSYALYHRAFGVFVHLFDVEQMEQLLSAVGFVVDADVRATKISRVLAAHRSGAS